jgi:hypothetical protein
MGTPTEIFLTEQHPRSRRSAVFEDDGVSGWLYLTARSEKRIVADCWVYNRIPAPDLCEIEGYRGTQPPAGAGYAGPDGLVPEPDKSAMAFLWSEDGESLAFLNSGSALGFIVAGEPRGFSRHLRRSGPWGHVWDTDRFNAVFVRNQRGGYG